LDGRPCHLCRQFKRDCNGIATGDAVGLNATVENVHVPHAQAFETNNDRTLHSSAVAIECALDRRTVGYNRTDEATSASDDVGHSGQQSGHIVGPAAAHDVQILEQYTSPTLAASHALNRYNVFSSDAKNPIIFLKVPRQRSQVYQGNGSAGFKQYESIVKVLEPLGEDVLDL